MTKFEYFWIPDNLFIQFLHLGVGQGKGSAINACNQGIEEISGSRLITNAYIYAEVP